MELVMNIPARNTPIILALGAASLLGAISTSASANPRLGIGEIRRSPMWTEGCGAAYVCTCFNELTGTAGPPSVEKRCFIQLPYPGPNIPPQHSIPGTASLPPGSLNGTPLIPVSPGTTAPDGQAPSQSHYQPQPPQVGPSLPNGNGFAAPNNALSAAPYVPAAPRFAVPSGQGPNLNQYQPRPPQVAPRVPNGNGIVMPNNALNRTVLIPSRPATFAPNGQAPSASLSQQRLRQVAPSVTKVNRVAMPSHVRPSASFASKPNLAVQRMAAAPRLTGATTMRTAGSMRLSRTVR
jgi:hypothetical protein